MPIPAPFTEAQDDWILALAEIQATDHAAAQAMLQASTPVNFSKSQAACVKALLTLEIEDFVATLADATEPCELRHRLRAMRGQPGL